MIVYWFRNNLRIEDNPSLNAAVQLAQEQGKRLVLFFSSHLPFKSAGPFRRDFIDKALKELSVELSAVGLDLILTPDPPDLWIKTHAKGASIYTESLPGPWESEELQSVIEVVGNDRVHFMWNRTLYPIELIPGGVRELPTVFSHFYRGVVLKSKWPIPPPVDAPWRIDQGGLGQDRLKKYLWGTQAISSYKETRNGLLNDLDSSRLSPFLSVGRLSARQVYSEVKKFESLHGANPSTEAFIYELIWRDYFQFYLLKYGSKVFGMDGILETPKPDHRTSLEGQSDAFLKWTEGKTAHRFINAHMNELRKTGWMSNRGRQVVASYLVNDLQLDWRLGANYFEEKLIDYDVASNWGNWNYIAGVGADPRKNRYFDPNFQASRYDPDGRYQDRWA